MSSIKSLAEQEDNKGNGEPLCYDHSIQRPPVLRFMYTEQIRELIFPLLFVAFQCEHEIGFFMNPS